MRCSARNSRTTANKDLAVSVALHTPGSSSVNIPFSTKRVTFHNKCTSCSQKTFFVSCEGCVCMFTMCGKHLLEGPSTKNKDLSFKSQDLQYVFFHPFMIQRSVWPSRLSFRIIRVCCLYFSGYSGKCEHVLRS